MCKIRLEKGVENGMRKEKKETKEKINKNRTSYITTTTTMQTFLLLV
jgi:hypothetical protein